MNTKKATPKKEAAPITKANPTINKILCPRQKRVLFRLINGACTPYQLKDIAGNNPPQTIVELKRRGLVIDTVWRKGIDKYGEPCRYGEYHLDAGSMSRAKGLLGVE